MATFESLAAKLASALRPLAYATQSDGGVRALVAQLGWTLDTVPPCLTALGSGLASLYTSLGQLTAARAARTAGTGTDADREVALALASVAADVALVLGDLHALPAKLRAELPAAFIAATHIDQEIERRLFDWLLSLSLSQGAPLGYRTLRLLGVIEVGKPPADAGDTGLGPPAFGRHTIRWDRLFRVLDPASLAREVYGWGTPTLDGARLFDELTPLSFALGMPAERRYATRALSEGTAPGAAGAAELVPQLWIPIVRTDDGSLFVVVTVVPRSGTQSPPGFALTLVPSGAVDAAIPLGDGLAVTLTATAQIGGGAALVVRPGQAPFAALGVGGETPAALSNGRVGVSLAWTAEDWQATEAVSASGGTRLTARRVAFALGAEAVTTDADVFAELAVDDGLLVIAAPTGDGLLGSLIPAGGLVAPFSLAVRWSRGGLHFTGTAGLATSVSLNARAGPFRIHSLDFAFGSDAGRLTSEVAISASVKLGPVGLTVERIGLDAVARAAPGNLGPVDLAIGFKPPNGVGVVLDAGIVRGGGYLFADPANHEYAGALELQLGKVGVKAIGMLSTRPEGWSLLLLMYIQIPPVQLGFGFTLNGIGGMVGVQHGVDVAQLIAGMKTGAFDDILFPANPVTDAPRIIGRLRTIFPLAPRSLTIGPMADIGWGTPRIVFIRLGILLQVDNAFGAGPGPISVARLVLIGQLRVAIGLAEDNPDVTVVKLIIDILGFWDLDKKRYGFLAALRDSHIAAIDIVGGLGVWGEYGDRPSFLLAAGGFNPRFKDVPAEISGTLDRLGAAFKVGRFSLTLTGYFALSPGTIQFGVNLAASAKIGPVGIEGEIGFDALVYLEPRTHFIADFRIRAEVTYKGHTLASVKVAGTIEGPGRWNIKGKVTFSILWWDISKSFDESWGSVSTLSDTQTNVQALLAAELGKRENWSAQLPAGAEAMVTLAPPAGELAALAHPLGRFAFGQRVTPLGLTLQHYGSGRVAGPNRFEVVSMTVGGTAVTGPSPVRDHFARAQFLEMTEEERLTRPSFEEMDAGVAFSSAAFTVSANPVGADMEYETAYLDIDPRRFNHTRRDPGLRRVALAHGLIEMLAGQGAAARAPQRISEHMAARTNARIEVSAAPLAAADRVAFAVDPAVPLTDQARTVEMVAEQRFQPNDDARSQLVEEFELVGV